MQARSPARASCWCSRACTPAEAEPGGTRPRAASVPCRLGHRVGRLEPLGTLNVHGSRRRARRQGRRCLARRWPLAGGPAAAVGPAAGAEVPCNALVARGGERSAPVAQQRRAGHGVGATRAGGERPSTCQARRRAGTPPKWLQRRLCSVQGHQVGGCWGRGVRAVCVVQQCAASGYCAGHRGTVWHERGQ